MRNIDADELRLGKFVDPRTEWHKGWNDALDAASTQAPTITPDSLVKRGRCPYCDATNNDFIPINQTVEYSGIEMSLNRQGLLRVRYYHGGNSEFLTQDIIEIKHCPACGAPMRKL